MTLRADLYRIIYEVIETGEPLMTERNGQQVVIQRSLVESKLAALVARERLTVAQIGLGPLCSAAVGLSWTRDPFDRLQVAHCKLTGMPLLTKDAVLRQHLSGAVWD